MLMRCLHCSWNYNLAAPALPTIGHIPVGRLFTRLTERRPLRPETGAEFIELNVCAA